MELRLFTSSTLLVRTFLGVREYSKEGIACQGEIKRNFSISSIMDKDFFKNNNGYLIMVQLPKCFLDERPGYYIDTEYGLAILVRAEMRDSKGIVPWGKDFAYDSKEYKRYRDIEEFKADNFKLLREEIEFAAEATVSDFIKDLSSGLKSYDKRESLKK